MQFFGLTKYGYDRPIFDYAHPCYEEPSERPKNIFQSVNKNLTLLEKMRELDPYIRNADGFAYKSINIMKAMKRKKMLKPVGPHDMYIRPITESQVYGWWMTDPLLENIEKIGWIQPKKKYPYVTSEMSKYAEAMQRNKSIWVL
ncbi:unnamed protein product [Phyllotreta striolata]|uniref:Uncharacterized protein n=1 Tax=Phyllotreta striolata TaxID=444603 RepID=A0A9N9TFI1_PHYSR|nr:unnamed protein product [Phyllotreta striolata]